jgi:hypothetical protein
MELAGGCTLAVTEAISAILAGAVVCGVTEGFSTETGVLATVTEAPAMETCALTLRIGETVEADSASAELTDGCGPDWDGATEDTPTCVEANGMEAKLEGTKRDEISVIDDSCASVAAEET